MSAKITGNGDMMSRIISSVAGVRRLPRETSSSPAGGDAQLGANADRSRRAHRDEPRPTGERSLDAG